MKFTDEQLEIMQEQLIEEIKDCDEHVLVEMYQHLFGKEQINELIELTNRQNNSETK